MAFLGLFTAVLPEDVRRLGSSWWIECTSSICALVLSSRLRYVVIDGYLCIRIQAIIR
jgi:hypothetical protein